MAEKSNNLGQEAETTKQADAPGPSPQDSIADIALADLNHLNPTRKWFAEGMAAEKELSDLSQSGPLPKLYSQEETTPHRFSTTTIILLAGTGVALLLGILLFVFAR